MIVSSCLKFAIKGIAIESYFKYKNINGDDVIEDTKGIETPMFRLKKKLVEALYPGVEILVIKKAKA